ncbi:DUF559 domain-containing protein [Luteimonas sp. 50]|uniref:DUF559 domain-containing protein n=1 Tax=Cognatiluteimonas sedimenti TaxID=2927791 RepID=A0ABT0A429_9GAMM|nr:DUF559 domain-containing protein [Lysobacter sedimenti]
MRRGQDCNRARILRRRQTNAERRLWHLLRDRRLEGFKFRRQQSIGPYFADFACIDRRLVIEADGGQHLDQAGYDRTRTTYLESRGYRVLRFWNHQVLRAQEEVLEEVLRALRLTDVLPSSAPSGHLLPPGGRRKDRRVRPMFRGRGAAAVAGTRRGGRKATLAHKKTPPPPGRAERESR